MKIVHVPRRFVSSHWGGTETVILETCRQLSAAGHEVQILTSAALSDKKREVIEGIDVKRFSYFYPWLGLGAAARLRLDQKGGNLFSFPLLRALRKEPDVDILHLHTGKRLGGIVRHVARRRRLPYVVSLHGGLLDIPAEESAAFAEPVEGKLEWGKLLGWWVGSRRVFDDAAAILCLGHEELRRVRERFPRTRALLFPNGVDTDRFAKGDGQSFRRKYGLPEDAKVILVMGRIDPQKNQLLAVECLSELLENHPNTCLLLVGHVTSLGYEERVRQAIRERGLEEIVLLLPGLPASSPDLVNAFHAADVFLLPSIHEPFGIVILEAWAAGLPVAASRVGGVPSVVTQGEDGLLFESGSRRGLVDALRAVLSNPELAARLGEQGRKKARERYSWGIIARRLADLYEEVIRENPLRQ